MAYTFEVIRGATTYSFSGVGQPIRLESIEDLGAASVRNIEESGPYQDGATHLGERLEPSTFTLRFVVIGTSAAVLDGHRDTLNRAFKPIPGVPIILKYTRDDGLVRQVDTRRTGRLAIPLVKEDRPGYLHRAVVQLRAADPTWYDPTQASVGFQPPASEWWLGYNSIGTADVMTHVENPAVEESWSLTGTVPPGSAFSVFFRSGSVASVPTNRYAFAHNSPGGNLFFRTDAATYRFLAGSAVDNLTGNLMGAGTANYYFVYAGGTATMYRDSSAVGTIVAVGTISLPHSGVSSVWRGLSLGGGTASQWPEALPNAAVYSTALSAGQRTAINQAITIGSAFSVNVAYGGDFDSYPVITIVGELANPIITNSTTGDTLDFTGSTVGLGDTWTIDTRYGRKSALNAAGSSVLQYLSEASNLTTFRLAADPIAPGGTNTIVMSGSASGTAGSVSIAYYNRYLSY